MDKDNPPRNTDFRLALWIGAAVLVGVAIMIGVDWPEQVTPPSPKVTEGGEQGFASPPVGPPPAENPRAIADQLFNRAMTAHESGQADQAALLLPEAIAAYQQLEPLDADGLFHLALLQLAVGDPAAARMTADRILMVAPNHLLGLAVAAEASEQSAPNDARALWQRYLDAYDGEQGRRLEYDHHQQLLPLLTERARKFIAKTPGTAAPRKPQPSQRPAS